MSFKDHFSTAGGPICGLPADLPAGAVRLPGAVVSASAGRVWDCACGTGQASVALAEHFESVIATDASPQQIAAAAPHSHVTYRVAKADDSGLDSSRSTW